MHSFEREIIVEAPAGEVFDLISRVEDFSEYSSYIREVTETSAGVYRWRVELAGLSMEWESVVTESERPVRFAWRSVHGVYNAGSYSIEPCNGATRVVFRMEYRIDGPGIETLVSPLLGRLISMIYDDLLGRIKGRLEAGDRG